MIKTVQNIRKEILFHDGAEGKYYRRIVGGVGWPCEPKPGYVVVLGEEYAMDPGLKGLPLKVLAEREANSIVAIHQACLEFRKLWACNTWLADLTQEEAVRLFQQLNRGPGRTASDQPVITAKPIWLRSAPYSQGEGRLETLFQMLGMVQSPERKLLSYGPESKLPGFAIALDPKDLAGPAAKFPPLAALGYAVAEMMLREPWAPGQERKVITQWDRFKLGG